MKLNARQETFCQNIAILLQAPADAYINAGYTKSKSRLNASVMASALLKKGEVATRVEWLLNSKLKNAEKSSISQLHEKAIETATQILYTGNDYTKLSVIKEVLARTEPIIKQSQSIHVTINDKDKNKRLAILAKKRLMVQATDVTVDKSKNNPVDNP